MSISSIAAPLTTRVERLTPGLLLVGLVSISAVAIAALEARLTGRAVVEGLVVAIIVGALLRTVWGEPRLCEPGVRFAARELLEVAVCLMGISVDLPLLVRAGPMLVVGIVLLVIVGIASGYALGRAIGLPHKHAVLVACGNAICGNSAIATIAPVIGADAEDVASSIAFTAIFGVLVVLGLPLLMRPLGFSFYQYGVLAGLTVYAVPQVLAASFAVSVVSGQIGTLVKLVRVLMLGPVVLVLALSRRAAATTGATAAPIPLSRLVPWFIIGFLVLAIARSTGFVPTAFIEPAQAISSWLTIAAMAALGLNCDLRAVARAGPRVVAAVSGSLLILIVLSVALIRELGIR